MVRHLSGNPTYQDLTAWSVDNFRFADHPRVGWLGKRVPRGQTRLVNP
jgi:hypothetical protein